MENFNKWIIGLVILIVVIAVSFVLFFPTKLTYKEDDLSKSCGTIFEETGKCPEDKCEIGCGGGGPFDVGGCPMACYLKPCNAFTSKNCPLESCRIMTNCEGQEVCYYKSVGEPPECGVSSYYGQDVACCEGLIKRCGEVLEDGSCDSTLGGYDDLPWCLPCGNGVCDQFENKCSCPEDCK